MEVSATLVATMILRAALPAKTLRCSPAQPGEQGQNRRVREPAPARISQVSRMSCSVGMKIRTSPRGGWAISSSTAATAAPRACGPPCLPGRHRARIAHLHRVHPPGDLDHRCIVKGPGEFLGIDGGRGDDQLQVLVVGGPAVFRMPSTKSMFRLRSWASSTMMVSYSFSQGSPWVSASRMPSVTTLM